MKKNYYLVEENKLKNLLSDAAMLHALTSGGVDNWEWCGESCQDFVKAYIQENDIHFEDDENEMGFWFGDIGEIELENYPAIMLDLDDLRTSRFMSMELSN